MSLIEDIQNAAVDSKTDLATLLRMCKVLASRLDSTPLADWIGWESDGYPREVEVPDYRLLEPLYRGDFSGPMFSMLKNVNIPLRYFHEGIREVIQKWHCRQSIASIQSFVDSDDHDGWVQMGSENLAPFMSKELYVGMDCLNAKAVVPVSVFIEIKNNVRNRILDFALTIAKEDPLAGDSSDSDNTLIPPEKANQIFNTHVYGGSTNIVGHATNSNISFNISQGNFAALKEALQDSGVEENDIAELQTALELDTPPTQKGAFGSAVSTWIGGMVGKAANGSWNISVSAAGNVLGKLIENYYGL